MLLYNVCVIFDNNYSNNALNDGPAIEKLIFLEKFEIGTNIIIDSNFGNNINDILSIINKMGISPYEKVGSAYKYIIDINSEKDLYPHYPLFRIIRRHIMPLIRTERINLIIN